MSSQQTQSSEPTRRDPSAIPYAPQQEDVQRNYKLNVHPRLDPRDHIDPLETRSSLTKVPATYMMSTLSPVLDQGQLGSCTANGYAGMYATMVLGAGKPLVEVSRLMLYYGERSMEHDIPDDAGADPRDGAKFLKATGVGREDLWPYDIARFTEKPPQAAWDDAHNQRIAAYFRVSSPHTVKEYLARNIPIGIAMLVYEGMEKSTNGVIPMPAVHEQPLGGHWVHYTGYADRPDWPGGGYFRIRNSWGEAAGDHGDYYLPYAYDANSALVQVRWRIQL